MNAAVVGLLLAALYEPCLDQRNQSSGGLRSGSGRVCAPGLLESAALAGGAADGRHRRAHRVAVEHSASPWLPAIVEH